MTSLMISSAKAPCHERQGGCHARATLIERRLRLAQSLDGGTSLLGFDSPLARSGGRLGRPAWHRRRGGAADQLDQALAGVLAVALLGAVPLREDNEHAFAREPAAGKPFEAPARAL